MLLHAIYIHIHTSDSSLSFTLYHLCVLHMISLVVLFIRVALVKFFHSSGVSATIKITSIYYILFNYLFRWRPASLTESTVNVNRPKGVRPPH